MESSVLIRRSDFAEWSVTEIMLLQAQRRGTPDRFFVVAKAGCETLEVSCLPGRTLPSEDEIAAALGHRDFALCS